MSPHLRPWQGRRYFVSAAISVELRYYLDSDGGSPFEDWFSGFDVAAAAKVSVALARVEQGNLSNVKGVGEGPGIPPGLGTRLPGVFRAGWRRAGDPADGWNQAAAAAGYRDGEGSVGGLQTAAAESAMSGGERWH